MYKKIVCIVAILALIVISCKLIDKEQPAMQEETYDEIYITTYYDVTSTTYIPARVSFGKKSYEWRIKVRGNSTAEMPKKPYKIKLDEKLDIAAFGSSKDWVLLANYFDNSLLRNYIALKMGKAIGLENTPDCKFIDVYINDHYNGLYLLCEQVEVGKSRVHANYLLEIDSKYHDDDIVVTLPFCLYDSLHYVIKYPNNANANDIAYVKDYMSSFDSAVYDYLSRGDGRLLQYNIDKESFFGFTIIQELFKNPDAWSNTSIFMNINDGKLCMGPIWDFDLSAGNYPDKEVSEKYQFEDYSGEDIFTQPYMKVIMFLYKDDFKQYWKDHKQVVKQQIDNIDTYKNDISIQAERNFQLWTEEDYKVINPYCGYGFDENVEYLKAFLNNRYQWIDSYIQNF